MASASRGSASPSKLDELLTCPICLDRFTDPKTLACLHTFCCNCLESCRRPYRRDIVCPVCKRITALSNLGVQGLQSDFRIAQLRDIVDSQSQSSPSPPLSPGGVGDFEEGRGGRRCDVCDSESREARGQWHCPQCFMYYCEECVTQRHNTNALFTSHTPVDLAATGGGDDAQLLCTMHAGQPIRFVCVPCSTLLCTLCALRHDASHKPEALVASVSRYRVKLHRQLRAVTSRLGDLQARVKYLSTMRDSQHGTLREATAAVRTRADSLVGAVRDREAEIVAEIKHRVEDRLRLAGSDGLADVRFHAANVEALCREVEAAANGTPQHFLVSYSGLISRIRSTLDAALPPVSADKADCGVRFIPSTESVNDIIGTLQDYSISKPAPERSTSPTLGSYFSTENISSVNRPRVTPRRVTSILGAISPSRKETKFSRMKTPGVDRSACHSPNSTINVDALISGVGNEVGNVVAGRRLLLDLDQNKGWSGRLASPSSVALLPEGQIAVAETDSRLQLFDSNGNSMRLIGWGDLQPGSVAATADGIAATDQKNRCVKLYTLSGECISSWGVFGRPSGIAVTSTGNFVVSDIARHTISIHVSSGEQLSLFGGWGTGDRQFNAPSHVAIDDATGSFVVADSGNNCLKIFSCDGVFIRKFSFIPGDDQYPHRPYGVAVDTVGNIAVADKDRNRVCLFSSDGVYIEDMFSDSDGVRYPVDICIERNQQSQRVAVVETHGGFFANGLHNAVKVFCM